MINAMVKGFDVEEFYCKCKYDDCPCKEDIAKERNIAFMAGNLTILRGILFAELGGKSVKIFITSGARCPKHNKDVNGVPNSDHMKLVATDIIIEHDGEKIDCEELIATIKAYSHIIPSRFVAETSKKGAVHISWLLPW